MTRPRPIAALLLAAALLPGAFSLAQATADPVSGPADQTPPPAPTLVARELLVLQADRYSETANDPTRLRTTLDHPILHDGREKAPGDSTSGYLNRPMPLGLITFAGRIDQPMQVTVELEERNGTLHAHWPTDALTNARHVSWINVHEASEEARTRPIRRGEHWLAPLQDADDRLWLGTRDKRIKERFLLYDLSFPFEPTIGLAADGEAYTLLAKAGAEAAPALALLVHQTENSFVVDSPGRPQADQPVRFNPRPAEASGRSEPQLTPLAELLAERGYNDTETVLALEMVTAGIAKSEMSLVYVLPEGRVDGLVRLDIKPRPDELVRTAIVVLNNIDPDLGSRIKMLIAELGDPSWPVRDRAQRELEEMDKAAVKQLQDARGHSDPEIAFRVQQILEAYDLSQK